MDMPSHKELQPIPVIAIPPAIIPFEHWIGFFTAAQASKVSVGIHLREEHYHAESALRLWAMQKGMQLNEHEMTPEFGSPYINLELRFDGHASLCDIVIYKIRELVRVTPEPDEIPDGPEDDDAMELPDSNETLGIAQGSAEY